MNDLNKKAIVTVGLREWGQMRYAFTKENGVRQIVLLGGTKVVEI